MHGPDPFVVSWQGHQLRVRHDDPRLTPNGPPASLICAAVQLVSDVEGLRLALTSALGDRYAVRVADDGRIVGLWQR